MACWSIFRSHDSLSLGSPTSSQIVRGFWFCRCRPAKSDAIWRLFIFKYKFSRTRIFTFGILNVSFYDDIVANRLKHLKCHSMRDTSRNAICILIPIEIHQLLQLSEHRVDDVRQCRTIEFEKTHSHASIRCRRRKDKINSDWARSLVYPNNLESNALNVWQQLTNNWLFSLSSPRKATLKLHTQLFSSKWLIAAKALRLLIAKLWSVTSPSSKYMLLVSNSTYRSKTNNRN